MAREVFFPYPNNKPNGFSPAARVGGSVFVSGQVSTDANGELVGAGDAGAQAEQCFKNVEAALTAAGAGWDDVAKITCFLGERGGLSGLCGGAAAALPAARAGEQHGYRVRACAPRIPSGDRSLRRTFLAKRNAL